MFLMREGKYRKETNQFLVFLTFDVNIHCVHTAL